ncbi:MAG: YdcF family protein [Elusimicrobia bacterium]|nr:YdcF family protein [Elusimicrobiota bacterium]
MAAAVLLLAYTILLPFASILILAWWIDYSEEPVRSDAIVILSGDYTRSTVAADLFNRGLAPEVWISRPKPPVTALVVRGAGLSFPAEETVHARVLERAGVPKAAIHLYGNETLSTADEALALGREPGLRGKSILLVTSRYHARRTRWIFRRVLPGRSIRMASGPQDSLHWWRDKDLATMTVLEGAKILYYFAGGAFVTPVSESAPLPSDAKQH